MRNFVINGMALIIFTTVIAAGFLTVIFLSAQRLRIGDREMQNRIFGGDDDGLSCYASTYSRERGIKAVIALQAKAGIKETPEEAALNWDDMSEDEKSQTTVAHRVVCGGFRAEEAEKN